MPSKALAIWKRSNLRFLEFGTLNCYILMTSFVSTSNLFDHTVLMENTVGISIVNMFGVQMVNSCLVFKWFELSERPFVRNSDESGFWVFCIQIMTELGTYDLNTTCGLRPLFRFCQLCREDESNWY